MPVRSFVHALFNVDQCHVSIYTLQCPRCQSHDVDLWGNVFDKWMARTFRIVCTGRLSGRGDEWTDEPRSRCLGVRGGTLYMFRVAGREILSGPRWPLGTHRNSRSRGCGAPPPILSNWG
jgi:hypothetical protein